MYLSIWEWERERKWTFHHFSISPFLGGYIAFDAILFFYSFPLNCHPFIEQMAKSFQFQHEFFNKQKSMLLNLVDKWTNSRMLNKFQLFLVSPQPFLSKWFGFHTIKCDEHLDFIYFAIKFNSISLINTSHHIWMKLYAHFY